MAWTDYYVDLDATGGAPDGSTGAPWQTYQAAIDGLKAVWGDANADAQTRVFVRDNGTIAGALTFDLVGTALLPILWIGCTGTGSTWTRIGNSATTAKPALTCGTNQVLVSGSYMTFEGLSFSGSATATGGQFYVTGAGIRLVRSRFVNVGTNAASTALQTSTASSLTDIVACFVQASTSTNDYALVTHGTVQVYGCVVTGGDAAAIRLNTATASCMCVRNLVYGMGASAHGIFNDNVSGRFLIDGNTILAANGDGIRLDAGSGIVANNLIIGNGTTAYPINFTGTATSVITYLNNMWWNVASDTINGVLEYAADGNGCCLWNYGLAASTPCPNSASLGDAADFDLDYAFRGLAGLIYEAGAYAYQSYQDHGALQRQEDYPVVANARYGVTYGGQGSEADTKALTGLIEMPNEASPTGAQDATSDALVKEDAIYGSPQRTGTLAGGVGGGVINHPGMDGGLTG